MTSRSLCARAGGDGIRLEPLEGRRLLTSFLYHDLFEYLGYRDPLVDVAPPAGLEVAGFGSAVAGLGDVDGDGVPDFAVAAPGSTTAGVPVPGRVFVYSGAGGALLHTLSDGFARFGQSIAAIGDVNGDGIGDLLVGSPRFDADRGDGVAPTGRVYVFSGADGSTVHAIPGEEPGGDFGFAVAAMLSIDADGPMELVVGAPGAGFGGMVQIISGGRGTVLRTHSAPSEGGRFGSAVAASPVLGQLAVGAPGADAVYVFDRVGSLMRFQRGTPGDELGTAVAFVSEEVVLMGAPGADVGGLADAGTVLWVRLADPGWYPVGGQPVVGARSGSAITIAGDIDGDGWDDAAVSAPGTGETLFVGNFANTFPSQIEGILTYAGAIGDVDGDGIAEVLSGDGQGRVTLMSSIGLGPSAPIISGASANGRYMWINEGTRPMLIVDGVAIPFWRIPGLRIAGPGGEPGTTIEAIGDDGTIYFHNTTAAYNPDPDFQFFVLRDGRVTTLEALVEEIDGGPTGEVVDLRQLNSVEVAPGGRTLLVRELSQGRTWLLRDGMLTYLWHGTGADVNSAGVAVGTRQTNLGSEGVIRTASGEIVALPSLLTSLAINEAGDVLGAAQSDPTSFAIWSGGEVASLGSIGAWAVNATGVYFDNSRRAIVDVFGGFDVFGFGRTTWIREPGEGFRLLSDVTHGQDSGVVFGHRFSGTTGAVVQADGTILIYGGALTPVPDSDVYRLRPRSPIATGAGPDGDFIVGINEFGELVSLRNTGSGWVGRRLDHVGDGDAELVMYTSGSVTHVVLSTGDRLVDFDASGNGAAWISSYVGETIASRLGVFTNTVGTVHLAGLNADGELVMFYQTNGFWNFSNLSRSHFEPQGLATPEIVSTVTAYSTSWDGMNLAWVDPAGNVQVAWWAPGLDLWRVDNLSALAGAAPMRSGVTAFVTPWNTLHVNAVDQEGGVRAIWWAPGFGNQWRVDRLIGADDAGVPIQSVSLASYVTSWSGLTIFGIEECEAGEARVVAYWWSPEAGRWSGDALELDPAGASARLADGCALAVRTGGLSAQNVVAASDAGHILRYHWDIEDGAMWSLEDVTAGM